MRITTALAAGLVLVASQPVGAQPAPRFGLALSGGGARGLAHIGALQVLEEAGLAPDLVTGVSMGAVVGGLYAAGLSPDSIATLARETDWGPLVTGSGGPAIGAGRSLHDPELLIDVPVSGLRVVLPSGLSTGQQAAAYLANLTWPVRTTADFSALPVPFAAVAADLGTGEAVRLERGNLAQAIRASLAIPMVFAPVEMDGRVLVDGGMARTIPAEDARALGADILACIDVSTPIRAPDSLEGVTEVFGQSVSLLTAEADSLQRSLCDVVVTPDLGDLALSSFGQVDTLIEAGATAARDALPRIRSLLAGRVGPVRVPRNAPDVARIAAVRIEDDDRRLPEPWIRAMAGVDIARGEALELDAAGVDAAVARLFGTGSFETVLYRIEPGPDGDTLVLSVRERPRGRLGAGLRFDTENRAAGIVRLRYSHLVRPGSSLDLLMRVGQELGTSVRLDVPLGHASRYGVALEAAAAELFRPPATPLDTGAPDSLGSVSTSTTAAWVEGGLSARLVGGLVVELLGRGETFLTEQQRSGIPGDGDTYVGGAIAASFRNLDRSAWPRRGHLAHGRAMSAAGVGSQGDFRHAAAVLTSYLPLGGRFTAMIGAAGGAADGEVPHHLVFRAGGVGLEPPGAVLFDFAGYDSRSVSGRSMAIASAGLRWELIPGRFLTVRAAGTRDSASDRLRAGFALSAGADTLVGPVEATLMAPDDLSPVRFQFALGYPF